MSSPPRQTGPPSDQTELLLGQIENLRAALDAIRDGGVDAVVMRTGRGEQVYTLNSADRPYRVIVEEMGEAAATVSERGILLYANRRLTQLLEHDRSALLGRSVTELVHPAFHQVLRHLLLVSPGATRRAELELCAADAARVPVHVSVTGLDVDGVVVRCLVATDLTGPRQAEQEIVRAQARLARQAHELEEAQRVAGVGSWLWDRERDVIEQSTQAAAILGTAPGGESLTFTEALLARLHPDDTGLVAARDEALRVGGSFAHASRVLLPDSTERHVMLRGETITSASGEVSGMRGTVQDVTALTLAQQSLERSGAQFVAAFEEAPAGMALVDDAWAVVHANQSLSRITHVPLPLLRGRTLTALLDSPPSGEEPGDEARTLTDCSPRAAAEAGRIEACLTRDDGDLRRIALRVARVSGAADHEYVVHIEDITETRRYESRLRHLADHDALTGLLNRRGFRQALEALLPGTDTPGPGAAMVLLDLDNFTYLNDALGHAAGDELLQAVAKAIAESAGTGATLARIRGDEFAVLLSDVDADTAATATQRILTGIAATVVHLHEVSAWSTASAGIVMLDHTCADTIVANADLAMYAAKRAGGNRHLLFEASDPAIPAARTQLVRLDRIRTGLSVGQFELLARPTLCLASGRISGCEVLLHLADGTQLIEPQQVPGIAQSHGLSLALDRLMVSEAIRAVAELTSPPDFRWEITLSTAGLGDPSLLAVIDTELRSRQLLAESLVFAVAESVEADVGQVKAFATAVRGLGCSFALDDFGHGYGSFYHLKHLPLDYLRIGGEFVRELTTDPGNQIAVESIAEVARRFGLKTIARCVSDPDALDLLRGYGIDYAQGDLVGGPSDPGSLPGITRR